MRKENITCVVENNLCSACGSCAGVCGCNAIEMRKNPAGFIYADLNQEKCVDCGKCKKVCPSYQGNIEEIVPEKWEEGECLAAYIGYATSDTVRRDSQSGGMVSGLLSYMLQAGKIDGAVVADFDYLAQKPVSKYVSSVEEINHASGSYYSQVPMLETLWQHKEKRTAVVTLGCQSESIYLACKNTGMKRPEIVLGLLCGGQFSGDMVVDLIKSGGVKNRKLKDFAPRKKKRAVGREKYILWMRRGKSTICPEQRGQNYAIIIQTTDVYNVLTIIICMRIFHLVILGHMKAFGNARS